MTNTSPFAAVVLAGGGNRCFWQAGFWSTAAPMIGLAPEVVAGVSAGATIACCLLTDRAEAALEHMKKATAANPRNFYPDRLLGTEPAFPHLAIYRRAVLAVMDQEAMTRLRNGPELLVQVARPPVWAGPRLAVLVGFSCYALERAINQPVHPQWAGRVGFRPEVVSASTCQTAAELADLLLASSCTPPLTPVMGWRGRAVLDGGLVDNVPVAALGPAPGATLVLLTRRYPEDHLPRIPGRIYLQPSAPLPVVKWDYTNPRGLQLTYDLGRRDGEEFAALFRAGEFPVGSCSRREQTRPESDQARHH